MGSGSKEIIIVGGGLGGLISAILLNRVGFQVSLFERKRYPFHRVCGEYISNETLPFLKHHGLFPDHLTPPIIRRFLLSSISGRSMELPLEMGGFGVSRFSYDQWLADMARREGVALTEGVQVQQIRFRDESFSVEVDGSRLKAPLVIGAFGKRSRLDKELKRPFIEKRSPFIGVKYHVKMDFPDDLIALHNFPGGYCGISKVEGDTYNICYLSRRENLKDHGNIPAMEEAKLKRNPLLKHLFENSDFILQKPEVINEISFERKNLVEDHMLMVGDSAGLITPLCGNGMAMAIHGAKMLAETISRNWHDQPDRFTMEYEYLNSWNGLFRRRLWIGRQTQNLFGGATSEVAVGLGKYGKPLAKRLVALTHGSKF